MIFIFGGCGGRSLREPPKITPLRGEVIRAAACYTLFADGGGHARAEGELQSAAVGRRRTARLKEPQAS